MSKIVILDTRLGAPQIIDGLIEKIAAQNQGLAEWIRQIDTLPIIRECVENALNRLAGMDGIQKGSTVTDYYGKSYSGKLDGILKTAKLSNGLGFRVTNRGIIEFATDDYRTEWKEEIERLRGLFADAFTAEVTLSILQILGYQVEIQTSPTGDGGFFYCLEGVKQ